MLKLNPFRVKLTIPFIKHMKDVRNWRIDLKTKNYNYNI